MVSSTTAQLLKKKIFAVGGSFSGLETAALLSIAAIVTMCGCFFFPGPAYGDDGRAFQERFDLPRNPDETLKEILARDEFHDVDAPSFIELILRRLLHELGRLLKRVSGSFGDGFSLDFDTDIAVIVVFALFSGLLAFALFFGGKALIGFIRRGGFSFRRAPKPDRANASREVAGAQFERDAAEAARSGDYRRALILLFRFALRRLDEQGRLNLRPGRTNRELLAAMSSGDPARTALEEMVSLFNPIRYGAAACEKAEYERFLALCRETVGGK